MATNNAAGSIVGHDYYNDGWHGYGTGHAYAGRNGSTYYAYVLKFKTPAFLGASESIKITLSMIKGGSDTFEFRYALCSSDTNYRLYQNTYSNVSDAYQMAAGSATFYNLGTSASGKNLEIATSELKPSTTYYLYLWAYSSSSSWVELNSVSEFSVRVYYNQGLIRYGNGEDFDTYQVYVGNGEGLDLYLPYIGNGSGWDLYS